jgi:hypothetical protein
MARPVKVDQSNRRSDSDALEGAFCKMVAGPNNGQTGIYRQIVTYDSAGTGYPLTVVVAVTKPYPVAALTVQNYADITPA